MKLWLLKLPPEQGRYDCAYGFVVRAKSVEEARKFASQFAGDEGKQVWLSEASCEEIAKTEPAGVILRDFRNG